MITLSLIAVAVKTSVPGVLELTVKVAWPLASVDWISTGLIVGEPGPEVFSRVTPSFSTARPLESFRVTVIVETEDPSAGYRRRRGHHRGRYPHRPGRRPRLPGNRHWRYR
jgi:hypothetical protein